MSESHAFPAVVLDIGHSSVRAGIGREVAPNVKEAIVEGRSPLKRIDGRTHVEVESYLDLLREVVVVDNSKPGLPGSLNLSEEDIRETGLVLVEPSLEMSRREREGVVEGVMEGLGAAAVFMAKKATMATFASGKHSGVAIGMGSEGISSSLVLNGCIEQSSHVQRLAEGRGGNHLDSLLEALLEGSLMGEISFPKGLDEGQKGRWLRKSREDMLTLAGSEKDSLPLRLPDGSEVHVSGELSKQAEKWWEGEKIGEKLCKVIEKAVEKGEVKPTLVADLILYGGVADTPGMAKNLEGDVRGACRHSESLASVAQEVQLSGGGFSTSSRSRASRGDAPWLGASILTALSEFPVLMINCEEYAENGAGLVHRKCP